MASCVSKQYKHGYMFDLADHDLLQEGVTTKEKVIKIMGSPTIISDLDSEEVWIYYSEDAESFLFFRPEVTARNILFLKFNSEDTIKELRKIDLAQEEKKLLFAADYTEVVSHKVGFFKSFFSNVGSVKPQ